MFLAVYNLAWAVALPFLACSSRLREGWKERLSLSRNLPKADIWLQASSAGEAYLACQLVEKLNEAASPRVLVTCSTTQGLEIYRNFLSNTHPKLRSHPSESGYFPFDMPLIMGRALETVVPRVMVVLETELWPGLFSQCKKRSIPVIILNGRLSEKSLKGHLRLSRFWRESGPARVLAISSEDAARFKTLFPNTPVDIMKNMKFDRVTFDAASLRLTKAHDQDSYDSRPIVVLGSVRKEEEPEIVRAIKGLMTKVPEVTVALFPRHMHRVGPWLKSLNRAGIRFVLRSKVEGFHHPGKVILWDTFGELSRMYMTANAAFVGGTLRPCGGQNFLEPLAAGIVPYIGPYWDNFAWIGRQIIEQGLAREVKNAQELVDGLVQCIREPMEREEVITRAKQYVRERQGGTEQACQEILQWLG